MAGRYDGEIRIKTAIETDGFTSGGKEVEAAARRMAKTVSGIGVTAKIALQKQTDAFVKQNQAYAQQIQKVETLKEKLKEIENQKIPTEEYKNLEAEMEKLDSEMEGVIDKQKDLMSSGFSEDDAYKVVAKDIERIGAAMDKVINKQKKLKSSGAAYKIPDTSTAEKNLAAAEQKAAQMHTSLGTSYESLKAKVDSYGRSTKNLTSIKNRLIKSMGKLASASKRVGSAILGLNKNTKRTQMSMSRMLGTSILFSTVFRAISAVTKGIGEGINNLAQYSDSTNRSLSSLMSALTQLKNSFATSFAPILDVVAPILTTFINLISRAVTYVGMFIAALTGQKTFAKAIGVQQDYAASLENSAEAAKDASKASNDYLSGLDEVRRFDTGSDKTSSDGGGGGASGMSPEEMFETVPIENSIANMVQKIKDLIKGKDWEGLGDYLAGGINRGLQKVYDVISWDNVGPQIVYFVDAFTGTFNSLTDNLNWDLLGRTVGTGINTVVNSLNRLIDGIDWINLGTTFANGIMGLVDEVNWTNLGNLLGNKLMIAWQMFYGFVTNLDYVQLGLSIANLINGAIEKLDLGMMASSLSTFVVGLLEMLSTTIQNTDWTAVGQQIADALRAIDWLGIASGLFDVGLQLINGLLSAFGELPEPVQIAAAAVGGFFLAFEGYTIISNIIQLLTGAGGITQALGSLVSTLGGPVTLAIAAAIAILVLLVANWDEVKATMQKFDKWLQGVFSHDWTKEFGVFGNILNAFFKNVSNIWNSIKKIFNGVIDFITGVFSGNWRQAWEGIKQIFSGVFEGLANIAKTPLNAIIGAFNGIIRVVNSMISKINSISFKITVPDWIPVIGGSWWGFNGFSIPQIGTIPYLATGAVIPPNAPFMAMLGDQKHGNNIEAPEDLIRKIVREETQNQGFSGEIRIPVMLDGRKIYEAVVRQDELSRARSGRSLLGTT